MRKFFFIVVGFFVAAALIGCETVKGIGKDIEGSSSAVQNMLSRRPSGHRSDD